MSENKSAFSYMEAERLKKEVKAFAIACIIFIAVALAAVIWSMTTPDDNAELKADNTRLEKEKISLNEIIKAQGAVITSLESQAGNLVLLNKSLEIENMALANQISDYNKFLFPWGNAVTKKLEETMDFRPLTILKCDDIACWLYRKAREFREFYR